MDYKFYDSSALLRLGELPKEGVISSITDEYLDSHTLDVYDYKSYMLFPLLNKMEHIMITESIRCLACAIDYDKNVHPDETIFVTAIKPVAELANKFFGEDSIILL